LYGFLLNFIITTIAIIMEMMLNIVKVNRPGSISMIPLV
jgi:hypothetical protein